MKLSIFLLFVSIINVFGSNTYSQNTRLNLDMKDVSIGTVLNAIEGQSEFFFLYSSKMIDVTQKVNVNVADEKITDVLDEILANTDIKYAVRDRQILLVNKEAEAAMDLQQKRITGIVSDNSGNPIAGANVVVTGTTIGLITGVDGKYSIDVPQGSNSLTFSFIGMESKEISIGTLTKINVTLAESAIGLEEVVVVGYGTQKKSDITGSVVSVSNEQITARPVNNIFESIQGKAAGVDITSSLRPGTVGSISIRGARSLTASNSPLYVVDGIPIMSQSGIETLNEQDIQSIEILKDASSTAIYGSRGANGVILITTKRGTDGKLTLNYSGSVTSQKMIWDTQYMDVAQYVDFLRWGAYNVSPTTRTPGNAPTLANDATIPYFASDATAWIDLQKGWASGTWDPSQVETFDWLGMVTQPNLTQEHTISGSGGTKTMKAYGSIGYLNNQGTTKGQAYKRYTVRSNVELTPKDWITFGTGVNGSYMFQDYGQSSTGGSSNISGDLISQTAKVYPYALPYDEAGNLVVHPGGQSRVWNVSNEWNYSTNQRETLRILGSLFAEVKLLKGLRYRMNFGPDFRFYKNGYYNDSKSFVREGGLSNAGVSNSKDFSYTIDNLLYYDNKFGSHTISATLLQTASKWTSEASNLYAQGVEIPSQRWYSFGSLTSTQLTSWGSSLTERQLESYMARVNYNYNDKYLLTLSGRWDGASQLAAGNKWAFFPSAAIGWRIDQESFLDGVTWIDQLKLRLSFGTTGNSAVDPYSTKGAINQVTVPFGAETTTGYASTSDVSNTSLGWEKTTQYNLAVDFSLFKGRVNGTLEGYKSNTNDLLLNVSLPSVSGYTSTIANVGQTSNNGIDITLNAAIIDKSDFSWNINATAAFQKDNIVSLMNGKEDMVDKGWFIGQSIGVIYNYERLGIWQDTPDDQAEMAKFNSAFMADGVTPKVKHSFAPGMTKVKDQNGDYQITANDDRVILGNNRPRFTVGLTNSFSYKGIELSVFLTGRLMYDAGVGEALTGMFGDQRVLDYWTPDNTTAEYQKPIMNEAGGDSYSGTYYKDNSYIKVKNISLGYNVPKQVLNWMKISSLKVYAQVQDAGMLWSQIKYRDAEYNSIYYNRGVVLGINVGF